MREQYGRPHQLIIDESHHLLPEDFDLSNWESVRGVIFITVEPDKVAPAALRVVDVIIAAGEEADRTLQKFCRAIGVPTSAGWAKPKDDEVLLLDRRSGAAPIAIQPNRGKRLSPRHSRKYAEAELPEDRSFYFRGPDQKLNLRAQNLKLFMQIAAGIDDATWLYHLRRHDYSRWIREALKDESLADEIDKIETTVSDPNDSRDQISKAIERRYTASS
jgi:hypothetical protein